MLFLLPVSNEKSASKRTGFPGAVFSSKLILYFYSHIQHDVCCFFKKDAVYLQNQTPI
jgi:hypothetical protein